MTQEGTGSGQFAGKPEAGVGKPPLLSGGGTFLSPRPRTSHHGFAPGMPATEMGPQGSQQVFRRLGLAAALQGSRRRGRRIQPIRRVSGSGGRKTPAPVRRGGLSCPPLPGHPTMVSRQECPQPRWVRRVHSRFSGDLAWRRPFKVPVEAAGSSQFTGYPEAGVPRSWSAYSQARPLRLRRVTYRLTATPLQLSQSPSAQ